MLTLNSFTTQSIYVTKVQPDGPAAFGLVPGDRILEVTKALVFDAFFFFGGGEAGLVTFCVAKSFDTFSTRTYVFYTFFPCHSRNFH